MRAVFEERDRPDSAIPPTRPASHGGRGGETGQLAEESELGAFTGFDAVVGRNGEVVPLYSGTLERGELSAAQWLRALSDGLRDSLVHGLPPLVAALGVMPVAVACEEDPARASRAPYAASSRHASSFPLRRR